MREGLDPIRDRDEPMTIVNDSRKLKFESFLTRTEYKDLNECRRGNKRLVAKPHRVQVTASLEGCCECGKLQAATVICGTCMETGAYPLSPVYLDLYYPSYE